VSLVRTWLSEVVRKIAAWYQEPKDFGMRWAR
jgi:hypothetical protein